MNFKDIIGPDELDWKVIPLDWEKIGKDELKLGTPMSRDGVEANDASCYGILMDDVEKDKHFQARVIVSGCVDFAKAEEYSGIKISEEAKKAIGKVWSQGGGVSSWNDLTDKPFDENGAIMPEALPEGYPYKEQSETVVLAEQTMAFTDGWADNVDYEGFSGVVEGDTLRIVFDNNEYTCNGVSALDGLETVFGNASIMDAGEDTGEPFVLNIAHNYQSVTIGTTSEGDTHTVAIYKQAKTIHTMALEFLPAGVGTQSITFIITSKSDGDEITCDKSFEEAEKIGLSGKPVIGLIMTIGDSGLSVVPAMHTAFSFNSDGSLRVASVTDSYDTHYLLTESGIEVSNGK